MQTLFFIITRCSIPQQSGLTLLAYLRLKMIQNLHTKIENLLEKQDNLGSMDKVDRAKVEQFLDPRTRVVLMKINSFLLYTEILSFHVFEFLNKFDSCNHVIKNVIIFKLNITKKKSQIMITHSRRMVAEDQQQLVKKVIQKPRQRNQFTTNRKFLEHYQKKKKQLIRKEVQIVQIQRYLYNNNVFRLHSNVQIPRNASSNQLGCLNINSYCYNYKINRIDRSRGLINLTLDPIDRPFIPVEIVKEMMAKGGKILHDTFWEQHSKKFQLFSGSLDEKQFQVLDQQELLEFENSIASKPVVCYISKVGKDSIVTQYNILNDAYLACLGINAEILIHYAQETGLFPLPLFFDENEYNQQHLSNFFKLNTYNNGLTELMATNYNGQRFPVKFKFHNYYTYDQVEKTYLEYLFFVWDLDKRWISNQRIQQNYRDYFNLKEIPNFLRLPQSKDSQEFFGEELRCGYKEIINKL